MGQEGTEAKTALSDAQRRALAAVSQQRTRVEVEVPAGADAFGAAEPAAARYEHQDYAALVQNLGTQTAKSDAKDPEYEQLHSAKQTALDTLNDQLQEARMSGDDVSMRRLQGAITNLTMAKDVMSLKAALSTAQAAISANASGTNAPETPEQKQDKAWAKIDKLNKEIDADLSKLDAYLTPEERKHRKELQDQLEEAKAKEESLRTNRESEEYKQALLAREAAQKAIDDDKKAQTEKVLNDPHASTGDKDLAKDANIKLEQITKLENTFDGPLDPSTHKELAQNKVAVEGSLLSQSTNASSVVDDQHSTVITKSMNVSSGSLLAQAEAKPTAMTSNAEQSLKVDGGSLFAQAEMAKPTTSISSANASTASLGDLAQQNPQQNKTKNTNLSIG